MKKINILFCFLICHFSLLANTSTNFFQADSVFTKNHSTVYINLNPIDYVSDYEHLFTDQQLEILNYQLYRYDSLTNHKVVIVTLDSIDKNLDFGFYAEYIFDEWKLFDTKDFNSLLLVISIKNRRIKILRGMGTENFISDEYCKDLIDTVLIPDFVKCDYFGGIKKALPKLMEKWKE